jgi:heme O synthase-like polyprenyltransferase
MLPSVDREGSLVGRQTVCYGLALVAAGLTPPVVGGAGPVYLACALLLGIGFLGCALRFAWRPSPARARAVPRASLMDLPALLTPLLLDGIPH